MLTINNLFIGTDIVEIERIKNSIDKYGLKFIEKIFVTQLTVDVPQLKLPDFFSRNFPDKYRSCPTFWAYLHTVEFKLKAQFSDTTVH